MYKKQDALDFERKVEQEERDELFHGVIGRIWSHATPHALSSGTITIDKYDDFDMTVRDPRRAIEVADIYSGIIAEIKRTSHIDSVAFIKKNVDASSNTVGALALAALICTRRDVWLPFIVIRLDKDIPHDRIKLPGLSGSADHALRGRNFIIVTDHISNGGEVSDAAGVLGSFGATVSHIVALTCRKDLYEGPKGRKGELEGQGIDVQWYAERDEGAEDLCLNERLSEWLKAV